MSTPGRSLITSLAAIFVIGCARVTGSRTLSPIVQATGVDSAGATPGIHVPDKALFWALIFGAFVVFYFIVTRTNTD